MDRMSEDLPVRGAVVVPSRELRWRFSRSSGPGGQSVNTTDSRVELSLDVSTTEALGPVLRERALAALADRLVDGVLTVSAAEHRSQLQNRRAARARLAALLRDATAPPPRARRATRPSRAAKERRIAAKKRRGETKRLRRGEE
jgi:ribosome-associated protein